MWFSIKSHLGRFAFIYSVLLFFTNAAYAITFTPTGTPDAVTMLLNLAADLPNVMKLITALAYVMGFFFIVKGVLELRRFAEQRSMMSHEHSLAKPLLFLLAGALLIYLPATVQVGLSTFWKVPNPYQYVSQDTDTWAQLINAVFMVVQLIGVVALIRGIVMLTHLGGHGGQQSSFGKAITFIIAGLLCINMFQFLQAVFNTLGVGQLS